MTALDDALNTSSVQLGPHRLKAQWREQSATEATLNPTDSVTDMSEQFAGEMTVNHSLDDGLPDPVTLTGQADASGSLTATVNGKPGLVLASSGLRTWTNTQTTGNWDSAAVATAAAPIMVPITNIVHGDFVLAAVLVNDATATLYQTAIDPREQWDFLGSVTDSPLALWVYAKRRWNSMVPALRLTSDKSAAWISQSIIFWAKNPSGAPLDYQIGQVGLIDEASPVTSHTLGGRLQSPGYQVGFWGATSASGVITVSGLTAVGNPAANGLTLASGVSSFRDAGEYTFAATQAVGNAVMCKAVVGLQVYERPALDARQYFSEFNTNSPVYGYERDTAVVTGAIRINTSAGPLDTQIFSGQMQGVPITGRQAELAAVSKTRIRMNRSVTPPIVSSFREGLTTDWFLTWLLAQGSQFVGPAPNRYTRYWAPAHGSIHGHFDRVTSYNAAFQARPPSGLLYGYKNPTWVEGPFSLGMFASMSNTETNFMHINPGPDIWKKVDSPFPHVTEAGGAYNYDLFSLANSKGRVCFWLRADPVDVFPSYLTEDYVARVQFAVMGPPGGAGTLGWISFQLFSVDGHVQIIVGNDTVTYGAVNYTSIGNLTFDGQWHFYGIWWDWAAGTVKVVHNGTEATSSYWATNGFSDTSLLAATDEDSIARGDSFYSNCRFRIPVAEFMYDAGMPYTAGIWNDQYPPGSLTFPGETATTRRSGQNLVAITVPTAINVWETLGELARSTLSAYRINEEDNAEFLPLEYFGEAALMTPAAIQDTQTNASDMEPATNASNSRNLVSVQFEDTRVDTTPVSVLDWNTQLDLSVGTTILTFVLDVPAPEIHGASRAGADTDYQIINLTDSQVTTPSIPSRRHFICVNTVIDGSGTYLTETQVKATIMEVGAQSITIRFVNFTTAKVYLVNDGDNVPFMRILGYGVRSATGYTSVRDTNATLVKGERGLDTALDWVQDRTTAADMAGLILGIVDRPRPVMTFRVMGDPRRHPGEVVTVKDAAGTQVSGLWRLLSVQHNVSGAEYTQDLLAVMQAPIAVWDGMDGWDEGVWGE